MPPSSDDFDFSHLPTADSVSHGVDKKALWQQHRRETMDRTDQTDLSDRGGQTNHPPAHSVSPAFHESSSWDELLDAPEPPAEDSYYDSALDTHEPSASRAEPQQPEAEPESWLHEEPAEAGDEPPREDAVVEVAPADNSREIKQSAKRALLITIGLHLAVVFTLGLMHTAIVDMTRPEIVAITGVEHQEAPTWKKVTTAAPQASPTASISPMLAAGVSDFAMPALDFDASATQLNIGTSFGSFGTVGTSGAGAKISFLGNSASGRNIVYVVDISSSMLARSMIEGSENSVSRFELMQRELRSSIGRLSSAVHYQILFFSDYAIAHDAVDTKDYAKLASFDWEIRAGERNVKIPNFAYLQGTRPNIARSQKIVEECATLGGTNWGSGLRMALNGNPKPDVIFFMTDGDAGDEQGWADDVTENNSRGKRTIIHTTAMMVPGAADALNEIAKRNGGTFSIVMPTGKVLTGEQFFKQRGR